MASKKKKKQDHSVQYMEKNEASRRFYTLK